MQAVAKDIPLPRQSAAPTCQGDPCGYPPFPVSSIGTGRPSTGTPDKRENPLIRVIIPSLAILQRRI